jgi:tetratricopeptide (TPR) repeat protein
MEYASARATPELVGRTEILGCIKKAIESKNKKTQVIYITARGGMGKTRLLEEVVKYWNKQSRSQKETKILVVNRLVDLYHTQTHNPEGLIDEVVDALGKNHFKKYLEKHAALIHTKYEKGETISDASKQEMIDTFVEELNELGRKYDKLVLVFDTAEVLTYQKDPSRTALGLTDSLTTIARWLTQGLISRLRNVTVLIAGRPPKELSPDEFLEELNKTSANITPYPLPGFDLEETLEYFNVMAKAMRKENLQSAKRIQSIPEATQQVIHKLTQGEPFVLALLIDYLAITDELPSLEQREPKEFREELRDRVIEAIQKCLRPSDEVVDAVSWTPKGMGSQLLAWVLQHRQPSKKEIEDAKASIDELRNPKKRLSFVKIRKADDLVFFQDEMYGLMEDMHSSGGMKTQKEKVDKSILDFYEWKIKETREKIRKREMELDATRHTPERLHHLGLVGIVREEERLSKARAHLQAYQVEHVYYTLRVNPSDGFKLYLEYTEEAFQSRDKSLWLLLQDELLRYAYEHLPVEGLTWVDIEAHMGIRWIRSSLAEDEFDEAERRIGVFRKTFVRDLLKPGSYLDLELKVWETWVLVYRGSDPKDVRTLLNDILKEIENLPSKTSLDQWRCSFLKAYAWYWHGYLSRSHGEFKDAVKWYLQTLPLWRELKIEVQAATTLNDLSWAEAERGAFDTAISHCKDGLELRRQLGDPYLIAFSLNTMGLIEIRSGKPETARFHCEQALEKFRRKEDARGIGLACLALAESLRRTTNTDMFVYLEEKKIEYLTEAAKRAEEAVSIFTEKEEPLRLVEAYIELGCVYREWIRQLDKDKPEQAEKIELSRAAFEMAVKVARKTGYEYRAIDALVNMAWLYYYAGNFSEARNILEKKVRNQLGDEYLYTKGHGVEHNIATPWHWVQLGKANVLLGMMFFDEYQELQAKDSQLAEKRLRQAAHNWTLSMAYNKLYGNAFRDFSKGREDVYNRLARLNIQEMKWVRESMEQTHMEYHIPNDGRAFDELIKERLQI